MKYKYKPGTPTDALKRVESSVPPVTAPGAASITQPGSREAALKEQNLQLTETLRRLEESNLKYAELYHQAPVIYFTVNRKGVILESNLTGSTILGVSCEQLIGRSLLDFVAREDRTIFKQHYHRVYDTKEKQTCRLTLIKSDGMEFYGHMESTCAEDGLAPLRCRTIIADISQRRNIEMAERESKMKNQAILNTIPDTLFIQDQKGIYIDYHSPNTTSPSIPPKEFLGKSAGQVLPKAIAKPLDQLLKKTLKTGTPQEFEYSLPFVDHLRHYETRMMRLDKDKVLSIVRDVTLQKQAEKALEVAHNLQERKVELRTEEKAEINLRLKKAIKELKKAEKERQKTQRMETIGRLASGVAHEVRNPLNSIQAIVAVLNQDLADNEEFISCSEHINDQVDRLAQLMKDLLELGKQKQEEYLSVEPVLSLCHSAFTLWKQCQNPQTHQLVFTEAEEAKGIAVRGDRGKLQQVLINLLDNASQHSPPGSEITVKILKPTKRKIHINVSDQGKGIKTEDIPHIFEPFFTKRHAGTGLGLSIVKHIVDIHSGAIKVKNNTPSPGCSFKITLPRAESPKS